MHWIIHFLISFIAFFFIACSSSSGDNNNSSPIADDYIAPQPLTYHDDANITALTTGYGRFGKYRVETKSIANTQYNDKPEYQALHLQTTLYYPVDAPTPRPTLFFYSGYHIYHDDAYKALLYFVASKGYNIIFMTCPDVELRNLIPLTQDALDAFRADIDTTKVGFLGHSMGAGVSFWLIKAFESTLGSQARLLFPMASGYTVFNTNLIPSGKTISLPNNTKMIMQMYQNDGTTDPRIGVDLFLNNTIKIQDKNFMFIYGDATHIADHGTVITKATYDYDALMQRTIFRPLDALMDAAFNHNDQAIEHLKNEISADAYFNPYIGTTPQIDIEQYILPETQYPYNCSKGGSVTSKRKEYCKALGL